MSILSACLLAASLAAGVIGVRRLGAAQPAGAGSDAARAWAAFQDAKYFGGLDALRAFSVIAVIWTHTTLPHSIELLNQGHRGVDLFFAISGFLVTTLLLKEYRRSGTVSLRDFYMRRTLRIFPLYYAVLAAYCALVFVTLKGTPKAQEFWGNLPAFLTYTSNWFVSLENGGRDGVTFYFAWSLATEEQFYLLWPLAMVLTLKWKPSAAALVGTVGALLLLQLSGESFAPGVFAGTVLNSFAPAILFGVLFAVLMHEERGFKGIYAILGHRWVAPLAALAMLSCLAFGAPWRIGSFSMAVLVASVCIREDTWLHPLLRLRALVYIGTISYGIYLMHMLCANVARKALGQQFGTEVFLLTIPLVIAVASASYYLFERPILRFKARFAHVPSKPATATGAADPGKSVAPAMAAAVLRPPTSPSP